MQIDPITATLGSTAASTTSVNGVNNFESYLNNAGNNSCLLYTSPSPRDS